ncbi:hypothetical protein NKR19_g419 [Coniochaeta hoffmannii]|uniref:MARVEL domain-containing protein n=1 Tax=Coniochaeta hoffmannii TaxID=91930 RepID=A0AA38S1Q9_9PEZI|nr:hypothetical protein NKR19_g419 [Coniochaeta hoffmannii]
MGAASMTVSVILRLGEFVSSVILLGIVGRFLAITGDAHTSADSRLIYAIVVASMGLVFSMVLIPPFTYSFMAFPLDFIMFVLALVSFILLELLTGVHTCNAVWYWQYWGYYWGGFWSTPTVIVRGPADINYAGCGSWKAVLAWTFILSIAFLLSSFVGAYCVLKYREEKKLAHGVGLVAQAATAPVTGPSQLKPVRNGHDAQIAQPDAIATVYPVHPTP